MKTAFKAVDASHRQNEQKAEFGMLEKIVVIIGNKFSEQKKRLVNVSFYLFASMVQLVVGLVTSPLISQTLNHRDFAIVGYFNSFLALFTPIVGLMLGSYYARTYFRVDQGKRDKLKHSIVGILVTYGILSTIVVLMLFGVYLKHIVEINQQLIACPA